ncbi:hypothetical protein C7999DRAFT_27674 [Corynascus novoguineensis]|uniref:Uncharacterized protein n=1 Tax=Corynascus novoguineensis TaxID=1126955 RepID=A0AAN7D2G1_9PEZI|nr:hypothetical protein C7999DRAFT_27674 [Corynascus novoguineensis]
MAESVGATRNAVLVGVPAAEDVTPGHGTALPGQQHAREEEDGHAQLHGQPSDELLHHQTQKKMEQPVHEGQQDSGPSTSAPATSAASPTAPSPLPSSFPKKRRGRPPGRPNTTVRDADYEHNPLVQAWNASKSERAVPVVSIKIREALTEQSLVHETQRHIFRMPSRETIFYVQGWITAKHIASQRPSYVNGLLIHSRGQDAAVACAQCAEKRAKEALGPFLSCRVLPGSYHNSCSNCKWFDNTSSCSLYTGPKPNRKRKAKEQLAPPPPAAGVGPPATTEDSHGDPEVTASVVEDQENASLDPRLHNEPVPQLHAQPRLQPEADMAPTPIDNGEDGQASTTQSIGGNQSSQPELNNGTELAEDAESAEDGDAE